MAQGPSDDVAILLATTRQLVGQAHRLSRSIDEQLLELEEFANDLKGGSMIERRKRDLPYPGKDRRRG